MDPGANTPSWDHSNSVNASASVPSSQLCIIRQLTAIMEMPLEGMEGKEPGRRRTCE